MMHRLLLFINTVRYLKPIQIYTRLKFKLYQPSINYQPAPALRHINGRWNLPVEHKSSLLQKWSFHFLNEEHTLNTSSDWDNEKVSKLWRYNLHYFDDLNAVDANSRVDWHRELLIKWVDENPPALGTAWESYPTSLRIVNWIKWGLLENELPSECLHSLAIQTRWLSKRLEYHILGNHLFANAKALVYAGLFFEGTEADHWLKTGLDILKQEVPEQVLADGGHFELSPMYHAIVLEDLLDLFNMANTFPERVSEKQCFEWHAAICKMLQWLQSMLHPDGKISFFNDAAFDIAATLSELQEYAKHLDINVSRTKESVTYLADSGYINIENGPVIGLLDVARVGPEYLPGHAHADTLSFELSVFGQRLFVNSGTSQYGNDSLRQQQRSTTLHNTVSIEGQNSSEVWSGFRVAKRAYPDIPYIKKSQNKVSVSCSHNGFKRLPGKCIHKRKWEFKNTELCITDKITGDFKYANANLYIHPEVEVNAVANEKDVFNLVMPSGKNIQVIVKGADKIEVINSVWYPEFGVAENNKCISVDFTSPEISMLVVW